MWDLVRALKGDVEVMRDRKMEPKRHWSYAYWLRVQAGINMLIANRGKGLTYSVTVEVNGRTCPKLGDQS